MGRVASSIIDSRSGVEKNVVRRDPLSRLERSKRMSLVKATATKPEQIIEQILKNLRHRFASHLKTLPGAPDFVFPKLRKAIFVHGCFWHLHTCGNYKLPQSRMDFWIPKLEKNKQRDLRNLRKLNRLGWRYIIIWECQMKRRKIAAIEARIQRFLAN